MDLEATDDDRSCYFSVRLAATYDPRVMPRGMQRRDFFSGGEWVDGVSDVLWSPELWSDADNEWHPDRTDPSSP